VYPKSTPHRRPGGIRSLSYFVNRWILHRPFLVARAPDFDLKLKVKTEDVVGRHLYKYQVHEPALSAFLATELKFEPGDVVIDIGANIGWYSLILDRLTPDGIDIFSFEPDPLNFQLLEHNLRLNAATKVTATQKALAAEDGEQTLYQHDSKNLGRHSLLPLQEGQSVKVATTSLDRFWDTHDLGTRTPRFIKIDIEGYELIALRGANSLLERCPAILCEYSPAYMRLGGIEPGDLVDLLTGHGFKPHEMNANGMASVDPDSLADLDRMTDLYWTKPV
jgi:FkbM family methyltransferase